MTETNGPKSKPQDTLRNPLTWFLIIILLLAILTRTTDLGARVMSHDEINHVYFAWLWFDGGNYQHNPVSHGPLQFHFLNLSYFLFGDNDVSARLPAALSGILAIALLWPFRRWFSKRGAIAAAILMLFSPFILYYSRYTRNEIFVVVETLVTILAVFRYVETKQSRWLYLLAATLSLHATTKETFYIQTAQWMLFLGIWLVIQLWRAHWSSEQLKTGFAIGILTSGFGLGLALVEFLQERTAAGEAAVPITSSVVLIGAVLGVFGLMLTAYTLIRSFGSKLREDFPLLDVLLVMTTLTLPLLGALPAQAFGWDPMAYSDQTAVMRTSIVVGILFIVSLVIGLSWDRRRWSVAAAIFFLIYIPLYTTFFRNPFGLFSGLVGSLGYWLVQQGVERGSQPWFYYAFLQIPLYEYLPAIGAALGSLLALVRMVGKKPFPTLGASNAASTTTQPVLILYLIYSSITTLLIYSYAGERMPWITVHLTLPLILLSGWWFAAVFKPESLNKVLTLRSGGIIALGFLTLYSLARALQFLIGVQPSLSSVFQGVEQFTGWALPLGVAAVCIYLIIRLAPDLRWGQILYVAIFSSIALLLIQTMRTSLRAAFVNYDSAKEYLVYAHAAPGPKLAMQVVEELSLLTTGGNELAVAYDNDAAYPLWWYLRNYPNAFGFGADPNRTVREYPIVFASDSNASRYEAYLGIAYQSLTLERLWWPREDYTNVTWESVRATLSNPEMLRALWDIWLDRDYERYGQITGHDVSARGWQPASRMKMYVRNDYAGGVMGLVEEDFEAETWVFRDTYEDRMINLQPELILGGSGSTPGFFSGPRGLAIDLRGWLYIADSNNHRIQVLDPSGELRGQWGFYADMTSGEAAAGGLNQPWDVAVTSNGDVIVVDTWNHRIQRFNAEGEHLQTIEGSQLALNPSGFYGPRGVAVDAEDRIFMTDTGNKRVVIFSPEGDWLSAFGSGGLGMGNLDEPVGLAVDSRGNLWVADTWNQRVQIFEEIYDGQFEATGDWPVEAWFGQSIENKPFLALSPQGHVCITDPEGGRVLCFSSEGEFITGFTGGGLILPSGIAIDQSCHIWIADAGSDRLLKFDPGLCPPSVE